MTEEYFTVETLCCPLKNKSLETCSGRYILNNERLALRNIKKAIVIAEEWLNDGELPSGKTWDDLYAHVLSEGNNIN